LLIIASGLSVLHDRVIAVAGEPIAHGFGVFLVSERPNLNMEKRISGRVANEGRVLLLLES
jgi:hypothetical protein